MRLFIITLLLLTASVASGQKNKTDAEKIRVVIITGIDWTGHIWKETAPVLKKIIEGNKGFEVDIVEDPDFLASDKLFDYDEIIMHFKNYDPLPDEAKAKDNLVKFLNEGKGLVAVHWASGAFEKWVEYRNIVGRQQITRHDKRGPFMIKIADRKHPVTKGMKDYETDDELFVDLVGGKPVHILATARSNADGNVYPMAFVLNYGPARIFHTTLGHDAKALSIPGTSELIRRGALWVAGMN